MARITTPDEIMAGSASYIDEYRLSLQFPACDWSGYFLFSSLAGDGPCRAVNLGICIGHPDGSQVGVPQWKGDPRKIFLIASVVCDGISYRSLVDEVYTRRDLVYSRRGLDLQVADVARLKGSWPFFEWYLEDREHDIVYDLAGRAKHTHYVPDHVYNNVYDYCVFPDYSFSGSITIKGASLPVHGVGGMDHVAARVFESPSNPGVGFWHYDTIHWDNDWVSNALFYVDDAGQPVITSGMMTIPDSEYHLGHNFHVEFLELAMGTANAGSSGGPQPCPRSWRATLESSHGTLVYTTVPLPLRDPGGMPIIEPNVPYDAVGEFRSKTGQVTQLRGRGLNEYMGNSLDPSALQPELAASVRTESRPAVAR